MNARVPAAATAAALLALLPPAASARPADQIRDARGDARAGQGYADILTARWSTTGKGAAKSLVATMTLAEKPKNDTPFVYKLSSHVRGCGTVKFEYTPGTLAARSGQLNNPLLVDGDYTATMTIYCHRDASPPPPPGAADIRTLHMDDMAFTVKGNTLTWAVPLSSIPELPVGSVFSEFEAVADLGEPTIGESFTSWVGESLDDAYGDGTWRMR